jgi:hypothetical protein
MCLGIPGAIPDFVRWFAVLINNYGGLILASDLKVNVLKVRSFTNGTTIVTIKWSHRLNA